MSKISIYPIVTPSQGDYLLGDQTSSGKTSRFSVSSLTSPVASVNPYRFRAYRNAGFTTTSGVAEVIPFDTKTSASEPLFYDGNSNFDVVNNVGRYTCPNNGVYDFGGYANLPNAAMQWLFGLYQNGVLCQSIWQGEVTTSADVGAMWQTQVEAVAGDYFDVRVETFGGTEAMVVGASNLIFWGCFRNS
jgi:hypothetical protein